MEKFFFIPPLDESLPALKAWQRVLLSVSFVVSLALFIAVMLAFPSHYIFGTLAAIALGPAVIPMQMYAMNREGRLVGKLYLVTVLGIALYIYRNWTRTHTFEMLTITLIIVGVYWLTRCIDQAGNLILERLDTLKRRVNSIESQIDRVERTIRKAQSGTEEIQPR